MEISVFEKPEILIIDDVKANSRLLAQRLGEDYECHISTSAREALEFLKENLPDLILLDILMPDMDGFELCRHLKEDERTRSVPVIFLTSLDHDDDEAKGLTLGAVDYIRKPFCIPVVKARIRNHIDLKKARDILEKQAFIDGLTTIPNRRRFDEVLDQKWQEAVEHKSPLSMILMDIDFFKKYNDSYGHQQGDDCLIQIGHILRRSLLRSCDCAFRYGGEEFAMILPDTSEQEAFDQAENIRKEVLMQHLPHRHSQIADYVTVSLGVALLVPTPDTRPCELLSMADSALYRAKEQGRNQVSY